MRQPSPRPATPRKRAPHQHRHCPQWTIAESTLIPMLTPEQIVAADAAELARAARPPRRTRPPQTCTVRCGHSASGKRTPALRLGGRWMEELGFTIGSTLCDGELVVSVAR
ncbi:SymE family type I addiction module toxin [Xanthomonas bundabergensis]|uniref:SymE family type I addiction module toxin n=1 Tax=Xanthomonas bundabergensis TaxID=3160842 RepID=UPI0035156E5D